MTDNLIHRALNKFLMQNYPSYLVGKGTTAFGLPMLSLSVMIIETESLTCSPPPVVPMTELEHAVMPYNM